MAKFEVAKDEWVNSNKLAHWIVQWNCLDDRGWMTVAGSDEVGKFSLRAGIKVLLKLYTTRSIVFKTKRYRECVMLRGNKAFRLYNTKTGEEIFPEIFQVNGMASTDAEEQADHHRWGSQSVDISTAKTTWKKP